MKDHAMLNIRSLALASAIVFVVPSLPASPFAGSVVNYVSGTGFSAGYTNASAALGSPSRSTPGPFGGPVDPFAPPYLDSQLVSVGASGHLTVAFDLPIENRTTGFGLDLIVFGNDGFAITNGDFSGGGITDGSLFDTPGASEVWVSANGLDYYQLIAPSSLAPMLDSLYPTDGSGDFQTPVNPALTAADFAGQGLDGIRSLYAGSGGGTGFDLEWAQTAAGDPAGLTEARFVRIDVLSGKVEIDGIAAVPEPASWTTIALALGSLVLVQARRNGAR